MQQMRPLNVRRLMVPLLWALCMACTRPEPDVLCAVADRGTVQEEVVASGSVSARRLVNVGSQISGTVAQVSATLGQTVHRGDALAVLDSRMLEAQLQRARAQVARAVAQEEQARLQWRHSSTLTQRVRQLTSDRMAAQVDEDAAVLAQAQAEAALHMAQASVQEARAELQTATTSRRLAALVSPIDGVIIDRHIEVGQTVAAQFQVATLFTIAEDMAQVVVLAAIDEADMGRIRVGMPVQFSVDAHPGRAFGGTLQVLRPAPQNFANGQAQEGSGVVTYLAEIAADNKDRALLQGMTAQVRIVVAAHADVVRVPAAALRFDAQAGGKGGAMQAVGAAATAEGTSVFVAPEAPTPVAVGALSARAVTLGLSDGAYYEVTEGLRAGERVAVAVGAADAGRGGRRGVF